MPEHAIFVPALYTHNETIDAQHKELIKRVNDLYDAIELGGDAAGEKAKESLEFLTQYTVFHFQAEENLMKQTGFPLYTQHKKIHDDFVITVRGLVDKLNELGPTPEFADLVEKEFTAWIINHIQGTDIKTIEWINNKGGDQMENLL
jgi:hemerythrin